MLLCDRRRYGVQLYGHYAQSNAGAGGAMRRVGAETWEF
jgi:hypothetical protein